MSREKSKIKIETVQKYDSEDFLTIFIIDGLKLAYGLINGEHVVGIGRSVDRLRKYFTESGGIVVSRKGVYYV